MLVLSLLFACAPETDDTAATDTSVEADDGVTPIVEDLDAANDAALNPDADVLGFTTDTEVWIADLDVESDVAKGASAKAAPRTLASGFTFAYNMVFSTDGKTVYVSDHTDPMNADAPPGGVFALPLASGTKSLFAGTNTFFPTGLAVTGSGGNDTIWFAGTDPETGEQGVFTLSMQGAILPVAHGFTTDMIQGVAAIPGGAVYVTAGDKVWSVKDGVGTAIVSGLHLGSPAGLALTLDLKSLLVSSLSDTGTSQVVIVDLATNATSIFDTGIGQNVGSGGVHRADGSNNLAWCGKTGSGTNTVYYIQL